MQPLKFWKRMFWERLRWLRELGRALIGAPDFDRYLAHCALHHPERAPLNRAEFFKACKTARFGRGATRCC